MSRFILRSFVLVTLLGLSGTLGAADYVVVESKAVPAGAADVTVMIKMANSDTIVGMALPLEIRSLSGGARPTSLRPRFAERLIDRMDEIQLVHQYDAKNGVCGQTGDSTYRFPLTRVVDSTVPVTHMPWGVLLASFRLSPENFLPPGEDSSGSLLLQMDVASDPGSFEIDTICMDPAVHSVFAISVDGPNEPNGIIPSFTKGVITITDCNCSHQGDLDSDGQVTALDIGLLIDYLFAGGDAPPRDSDCPHVDRGDIDCDGSDTSLDLSHMVDFLFAGGPPPCDPCDCDPYPASCP